MMQRTIWPILTLCLLGGCPSSPPAVMIDLSDPSSLDGNWRITSVGAAGADCVTVQGAQIVGRDSGCDGSVDEIVAATVASISGNRIVWTFATNVSGNNVPFTLDVILQGDGTLAGTVTIPDLSAGGVNSSQIMMVRE